jgi:hypothetical protein
MQIKQVSTKNITSFCQLIPADHKIDDRFEEWYSWNMKDKKMRKNAKLLNDFVALIRSTMDVTWT